MKKFVRRVGSDTFHTNPNCSKIPSDLPRNPEWKQQDKKPSGEKCDECISKDKKHKHS